MKTTSAIRTFMAAAAKRATSLSIVALAGVAGVTLLYFRTSRGVEPSAVATIHTPADKEGRQTLAHRSTTGPADGPKAVAMPPDKALSIGLTTARAQRRNWPERLRVSGRIELNESRVASVSSLVEGVVREVPVELGQTVQRGEVLAYIDSRAVGEAKLQLVKDQLQLTAARRNCAWYQAIRQNTLALIELLGERQTVDEIDETFRDRPVGAHRQELISALSRRQRAEADFERLRGLGAAAIVPEKVVIRARTEHESAEAAYRSVVEQIRFDTQQQALDAEQKLQAAEAAVAISRAHLLILGYDEAAIGAMDPLSEAERVAYYPVRAPIAGTVLAKDAPLSKHVDDTTELFRIADLSTVWLRADVFEKDLNAILGLHGRLVTFETSSYPGRPFTGTIFSLGNLVDDQTRASRVLAVADNAARRLKPGMFVQVELIPRNDANVLQLPVSAIQYHAGATFVFVADGDGQFQRRNVKLGRSTSQVVEIIAGLSEAELVVAQGGFALKSEMLSELMAEK